MGGDVANSYRFKMGFYGLGDMPNENQRIMDRLTEKLPNIHCYLNDILIAKEHCLAKVTASSLAKGSAKEHCNLFLDLLQTLDDKGLAIK